VTGPAEPNRQSDTAHVVKRYHIRLMVRSICLIAAIVALLAARQTHWPLVVAAMSPFIAAGSILATRTFRLISYLGLAVGFIPAGSAGGSVPWGSAPTA